MGNIGIKEMLLLGLVLVVLFGAKKLPELGKALGRSIHEFKKAGQELTGDGKDSTGPKS